jgi:hypothetical protein
LKAPCAEIFTSRRIFRSFNFDLTIMSDTSGASTSSERQPRLNILIPSNLTGMIWPPAEELTTKPHEGSAGKGQSPQIIIRMLKYRRYLESDKVCKNSNGVETRRRE